MKLLVIIAACEHRNRLGAPLREAPARLWFLLNTCITNMVRIIAEVGEGCKGAG